MIGGFKLYYPVVMSFFWVIGAILFNYCERTFTKLRLKRKDNGPSVEVFMSCYNEEAGLERSIDSLEQITYQNYRVFLIDDKSSDNTLQIMHILTKNTQTLKSKRRKKYGESSRFKPCFKR